MSEINRAMQGLVKGRVQGVFFRMETQKQAQKLGIKGWVRNTDEGHVEVLIYGAKAKVAAMILWLHKGPALANVSAVELNPIPCQELAEFLVVG